VINEAVNKFKELGYIDDKRFAEAWVESRKKTKGKTVLKIELKQKGIAEDTIIELLEEIEPEDEYQRALALVEKKHWPEMNKEERYTKVGGFLARKGFNYDVIRQILKETETKNLPE
jgi:regulatory protein